MDVKQKIKQKTSEQLEQLRHDMVEKGKQSFTVLSREVISQLFNKEIKDKPKNFTPLDKKQRAQIEAQYGKQDESQLEQIRQKLAAESDPKAALKKQFEFMKGEEERAKQQIEEEKKQKDQEELQKQQEEQAKRQRPQVNNAEPTTARKRGDWMHGGGKKKAQITIENQASQSKD